MGDYQSIGTKTSHRWELFTEALYLILCLKCSMDFTMQLFLSFAEIMRV